MGKISIASRSIETAAQRPEFHNKCWWLEDVGPWHGHMCVDKNSQRYEVRPPPPSVAAHRPCVLLKTSRQDCVTPVI